MSAYWSDTGLAAHLLGLRTWDEVLSHNMAGALFETFVMLEIVRQVAEHEPSARVHFLRTHTGLEVDGLLTRGVRALPFEIKLSTTVREEDGRPLSACLDLNRRADVGILFYRGRECRRLGSRVLAMPVTALLS